MSAVKITKEMAGSVVKQTELFHCSAIEAMQASHTLKLPDAGA